MCVALAVSTSQGEPFDAVLKQFLAAHPQVCGVVASISSPSRQLQWSGAAGLADRATGRPATAVDVFPIASVTKLAVAAALLRLEEAAALRLDDPITALVSASTRSLLTQAGYDVDAILVRHLLSHTSGLRDHASTKVYLDAVIKDPQRRWTRLEQIELAMREGPALCKPGEVFSYSDTGYVMAGEIIERLRRKPLGVAVRQILELDRLSLRSTWWMLDEPDPRPLPSFMHPYLQEVDMQGSHPSLDLFGGGGIVSTVNDLVRLVRYLALGEAFAQRQTLLRALIVPPAARDSRAPVQSHMGFSVVLGGEVFWGHTGFWGTAAFYCPRSDTAFAVHVGLAGGPFPALLEGLVAASRAWDAQR